MTAPKTPDYAYRHDGAHNVYYVKLNMAIRTPRLACGSDAAHLFFLLVLLAV
ncbi:hypothetical protein ymoll0001_20670 [Yersinia mollaretii ATCC 43969]|uniref:Uncharacterized protein n=1 Tax=Yersinia mollaretii (strain ATCC 43969 / DSM 18520 / CIP 103324 / CNY 7263 / WAIP 204) TaxID=349967 RepID=A0ABP2ELJ3_YERMW|nr:hypothetical protein ymoll0001_20670 [Yersinia mollaretii ATCC 43969]